MVGMAEQVKDPVAARLAEQILGTAQEWLRRMDVPDVTYGLADTEKSVVWMDDGTVAIKESNYAPVEHHYRVKVFVEPVDNWRAGTWREVAEVCRHAGDREVWVRLSGHEAQVESAVVLQWNVKPGTGDAAWNPPKPLAHEVTNVRLAGRENLYTFPPDGPVDILSPPVSDALEAILASFHAEPLT